MDSSSHQPPTPGQSARPSPLARARAGGEVLRALGGYALLPPRSLAFLLSRRRRLAEFEGLLGTAREPDPVPALAPDAPFHARPMRLFLSCAEASGQGHAVRLLAALREHLAAVGAPLPEVRGLGGAPLAAAGVELLGDPVQRATMGLSGVAASLSFYTDLLARTDDCFSTWHPDLFLPVDSPALHIPMARSARRAGVPVLHHVTPQFWAWAPWRLDAYARAVDLATSILPFEPPWFAARGVSVAHVGHPLMDALSDSMDSERDAPEDYTEDYAVNAPEDRRSDTRAGAGSHPAGHGAGRPAGADAPLVLLPGSRAGVMARNLPWMLETLNGLAAAGHKLPAVRILSGSQEHRPLLDSIVADWNNTAALDLCVVCGDLHGNLARARAAFSVSGTILLDLLHQRLPTVVIYRLGTAREEWLYRHALSTPWFSSVNLLAGEAVLPEFCFHGEGPRAAVASALSRALFDTASRAACAVGLARAAANIGGPGAARRAAGHALALAAGPGPGAGRGKAPVGAQHHG